MKIHEFVSQIPYKFFKSNHVSINPSLQTLDNADYILSIDKLKSSIYTRSHSILGEVIIVSDFNDVNINIHISKTKGYIETYDSDNALIESMTRYDANILELFLFTQHIFNYN